MSSGIYMIRNVINGKIYIGSTINLKKRILAHKNLLSSGKHGNKHLQRSWNKYGKDFFEFSVLEICNKNMLLLRESAFIKYYNSMDKNKGYNLVDAASNSGYKHTPETIAKFSATLKKIRSTKEWREAQSKRLDRGEDSAAIDGRLRCR